MQWGEKGGKEGGRPITYFPPQREKKISGMPF